MIRWEVREIAKDRGIHSAYEFALAVGMPYSGAKKIWDGSAKRLDFLSLYKICDSFGVEVGDVLKKD